MTGFTMLWIGSSPQTRRARTYAGVAVVAPVVVTGMEPVIAAGTVGLVVGRAGRPGRSSAVCARGRDSGSGTPRSRNCMRQGNK